MWCPAPSSPSRSQRSLGVQEQTMWLVWHDASPLPASEIADSAQWEWIQGCPLERSAAYSQLFPKGLTADAP